MDVGSVSEEVFVEFQRSQGVFANGIGFGSVKGYGKNEMRKKL